MISPSESFVEDLAARATVKTYGDISLISIPGIETIPESQHMAIFKKAEQRLMSNNPDADALRARLEFITPPPDPEEDAEEARMLEAQARQDLENDGCPPCYPIHLDVPIRNPPVEYRQIIEYWESFTSTDNVVLCAQRSDWREFRQFQQRLRHIYRNKSFDIILDKVRKRRIAHGLDDNVQLLLDPQQQSRQQNWIEFQDYHLRLHEEQKEKRDGLQKDLNHIREEAGGMNREDSEYAEQRERGINRRLAYAERNLRWHEVMLCWIEQCRIAIDPLPPTPIGKGSGDQSPPSNRQRRSKQRDTLAVLGNVRVSKPTPKCQKIRTRTSKATMTKPISVDSAITIPSSMQQQMPKRREMKPRRAKEKALDQLHPQRVAKANRSADTRTKLRSKTQCSGEGQLRDRVRLQRRSAIQGPYSTPRSIKTQSQRISREPVRWAPE